MTAAATQSAYTAQTRHPVIVANARVACLCEVRPRDGISWTQRSQPLRRADQPSLDSGQCGHAPADSLRPRSDHRQRSEIRSEGIYARVAASPSTLSERKTRAWNTARERASLRPVTAREAPATLVLKSAPTNRRGG